MKNDKILNVGQVVEEKEITFRKERATLLRDDNQRESKGIWNTYEE